MSGHEHDDLPVERRRRDGGFTLVELTLSMVVTGVLVAGLATAMSAALRATPSTEARIDDARSMRSLSTFLSHDTVSVPPFSPETALGGIDVSSSPTSNNNDCAADGTNILHLQWRETIVNQRDFVANYRLVVEDDVARVLRVACVSENDGPFVQTSSKMVTPELDPTALPQATLSFDDVGNVAVVSFTLTGRSGETVLIETASRNPGDFFS